MSDDLPPLGVPRRPGSPPRPEVLDAIVREGRRKLRRAAVAGTAGVALLAAGALSGGLLGDGGGSVVLVPATPEPGASAVPTAAGGSLPALASMPPAPNRPGHAMAPAPPSTDRAAASASPLLSAQEPTPSPRRGAKPYREAPATTTDSCPVMDTVAGAQVCASATASSTTVTSGGFVDVELLLCNAFTSDRSYEARFRDGREHDVRAVYGHDAVWTWSRAYTFPEGPHVRSVEPGYCLSWVTRWDTRDDDGRLVEAGVYYLEAGIELSTGARRFAIRVDVTEPTASPTPTDS